MKIEKEKRTVEKMIRFYCRRKHGTDFLCPDCEELLTYSKKRLEGCKFGDCKSSCKKCKIHCYSPSMRLKIREVMRFSGPRMFIYSPLDLIMHLF